MSKPKRDYTLTMPPPCLTEEAIEDFRSLYEQEFGESISKEDATIRAREIVVLYEKPFEGVEWNAARLNGAEGVPETSA